MMTKAPLNAYRIRWVRRLSEVEKAAWDRLALPLKTPFLEWDWLNLMETSGSITETTGWIPHHLTVWEGHRLVGAAPLYIKTHSQGEFVFDHPWVEVADRLGIAYYPKMVGMSPATPVSGYRFLLDAEKDEGLLTALMVDEIHRFCERSGLSGCSFLFVDPAWQESVASGGFSPWAHQSFVWSNPGYRRFQDYLDRFNTNQRRNIRREISGMDKSGIVLDCFSGERIPRHFFPLMYALYEGTNDRFGPWGCKYLTPEFFEGLDEHYRRRLVFVAALKAKDADRPLGMSMLVSKGEQLYGRYWGAMKPVNHLHFNVCYYEPIQWAISKGLKRFDPGLGGPHKLRRGFEAVPNVSLHRFYDPRLRHIMERNMEEINRRELEEIHRLNRQLPFAQRQPGVN